MLQISCPTCGGHLEELPEPEKVKGCLAHQELRVFEALLAAGPDGMDKVSLSTILHGERRGPTPKAMNLTAVLVTRVRRKLDQYGYHIQRHPPLKHGVYRIIPAEAGA